MRRFRALGFALLMAGGAVSAGGPAVASPGTVEPAKTPGTDPVKPPMRELPTPYTIGYSGGARPPPTDRTPDFAYGAYQRGQYVTAFREATKRIEADRKDVAAMTLLGELYNQGLGIKPDPVKAADWYRLAAIGRASCRERVFEAV